MIQRYILHNNFTSEVDRYQKRLVREVAEKFRLQKTLFQHIQAHFTLKYWFDANEGELAQVERTLKEFSKAHHPSQVFLAEIGGFPPEVAFIDVQLSPEAREVFESLIASLKMIEWMTWDRFDAPNLHFHSTIAEGCGDLYDAVIEYLASRHTNRLPASFDNITLTRQVGLVKELPLLKPYRVFKFTDR